MILGLDIGTKRTGVAISAGAAGGRIAREYSTLAMSAGLTSQLAAICRDEAIEKIVVGLPLNEDGTPSAQAEWVEQQVLELRETLTLPVVLEDEVLTTVEARRVLTEMGLSPAQIDQRVDQYAAQLILQQFLNHDKFEGF